MSKILLVEDDKSLREIYGVRLSAEGYEIVAAGDGEEALAIAVKERPDLIISDVMMPKISGFDMLDILRATPETKDLKVIMMTALSSDDQRQRGEALGANRYLVKSQVGIEDIVRAVHEVLADTPGTQPADTAGFDDVQAPIERGDDSVPLGVATNSLDVEPTPSEAISADNTTLTEPVVPTSIESPTADASPTAESTVPAVVAPTEPVTNLTSIDIAQPVVAVSPAQPELAPPVAETPQIQPEVIIPQNPESVVPLPVSAQNLTQAETAVPASAPTPAPSSIPTLDAIPTSASTPTPAPAPIEPPLPTPQPEFTPSISTLPPEQAVAATPAPVYAQPVVEPSSQLPSPIAPFSTPAPESLKVQVLPTVAETTVPIVGATTAAPEATAGAAPTSAPTPAPVTTAVATTAPITAVTVEQAPAMPPTAPIDTISPTDTVVTPFTPPQPLDHTNEPDYAQMLNEELNDAPVGFPPTPAA